MSIFFQRMRACRIYVTHTLTIRRSYADYARHTLDILNTLDVYSYVMNTLFIRLSRPVVERRD